MNRSIPNIVSNDSIAKPPAFDPALGWRGGSEDGCLSYSLTWTAEGLHVERVRIRPDGGRSAQSALFSDPSQFREWYDCDDMRFQYVHLCTAVLSRGVAILEQRVSRVGVQTQLRFG